MKNGFSRGVAKRTPPPGAQASKITLVLKGLSGGKSCQKLGARAIIYVAKNEWAKPKFFFS